MPVTYKTTNARLNTHRVIDQPIIKYMVEINLLSEKELNEMKQFSLKVRYIIIEKITTRKLQNKKQLELKKFPVAKTKRIQIQNINGINT